MAPISLRIVMDDGVVTRTVKFDSTTKVSEAHAIVDEKMMTAGTAKEYRLFLTSAENERTGIWLEDDKNLDFYMLRDGDSLHFLCKTQSLRVKMLDGSVKTILVDKAMPVGELMQVICHKIGLANHDEYGLCYDEPNEPEEMNPAMGTLTMKRKPQHREKDAKMEHLSKKLKTDDNVQWLDQHKSLRELNVDPADTLLLKRRLFYSDRKVDARDPVQLNLLYVQARDAILDGRHPVTSDKANMCKSRWANIRDMLRRKIRERQKNPNVGRYNYKYEEELSFLIPLYKESMASSHEDFAEYLDDDVSSCEVEMPTEVFVDAGLEGFHCDDGEESEEKPNVSNLRRSRRRDSDSRDSRRETGTSDIVSQDLTATDPIDVFLITVGSTLRTLTPYYLNQAKSKIFQVVQEYELKQIVDKDQCFNKKNTGEG